MHQGLTARTVVETRLGLAAIPGPAVPVLNIGPDGVGDQDQAYREEKGTDGPEDPVGRAAQMQQVVAPPAAYRVSMRRRPKPTWLDWVALVAVVLFFVVLILGFAGFPGDMAMPG